MNQPDTKRSKSTTQRQQHVTRFFQHLPTIADETHYFTECDHVYYSAFNSHIALFFTYSEDILHFIIRHMPDMDDVVCSGSFDDRHISALPHSAAHFDDMSDGFSKQVLSCSRQFDLGIKYFFISMMIEAKQFPNHGYHVLLRLETKGSEMGDPIENHVLDTLYVNHVDDPIHFSLEQHT